jgi:hypothetical protein
MPYSTQCELLLSVALLQVVDAVFDHAAAEVMLGLCHCHPSSYFCCAVLCCAVLCCAVLCCEGCYEKHLCQHLPRCRQGPQHRAQLRTMHGLHGKHVSKTLCTWELLAPSRCTQGTLCGLRVLGFGVLGLQVHHLCFITCCICMQYGADRPHIYDPNVQSWHRVTLVLCTTRQVVD